MKVIIVLTVVIGCASARSGPYLLSGWRPSGPAFYLPSEVQKPGKNPVEDVFQETEASGSENLREYGPPKLEEVSPNVNQALPQVATTQTFFAEVKNEEIEAAVEEPVNVDENPQQITATVEELSTATELQATVVIPTVEENVKDLSELQQTTGKVVGESLGKTYGSVEDGEDKVPEGIVSTIAVSEENIAPIGTEEELVVPLAQQELVQENLPTVAVVEAVVTLEEKELEQDVVSVRLSEETPASEITKEQELVLVAPTAVLEEVPEKVAKDVENIAEVLSNLENEIKTAEVTPSEAITSILGRSRTLDQPEDFLEYSPLGFAVYGPPKQENLARFAATQENAGNVIDNDEVRRRRLTLKLRSTKKD